MASFPMPNTARKPGKSSTMLPTAGETNIAGVNFPGRSNELTIIG